jgi:transcription elongation GreA/GreB family factor
MDSPLGLAVRGKALDQEIEVATPQGAMRYTIVDISYAAPTAKRDRQKKGPA